LDVIGLAEKVKWSDEKLVQIIWKYIGLASLPSLPQTDGATMRVTEVKTVKPKSTL